MIPTLNPLALYYRILRMGTPSLYILSLTPCSLAGASLQGVAAAEVSPSLPVLALPLSTLNPATSKSLAPVLAHPIDLLQRWSSPDTPSLNASLILSLREFILPHSHHVSKLSQHRASPSTSLNILLFSLSYQTSRTRFHHFMHHILNTTCTSYVTHLHCTYSRLLFFIPCPRLRRI